MSTIPSFSIKAAKEYTPIAEGEYEARIVRSTVLGAHPQRAYQGTEKPPAVKNFLTLELIGMDTEGFEIKNKGMSSEERTPLDPQPSCVFTDMPVFANGARGKTFDLCKAINAGIATTPSTLTELNAMLLNEPVNVTVNQYTAKDGTIKNGVQRITPIPAKYKAGVGEARCDLVSFDPYTDTEEMFAAYSKLFPWQRDLIAKAIDSVNIPFAGKEAAKQPEPGAVAAPKVLKEVDSTTAQTAAPADFDDDVPF